MTDYSSWTDEQVNEKIAKKKGWMKLGYPAVPEWQKPGERSYNGAPDYCHDWRLCGELLEEMVVADVILIAYEKSKWIVNWWDAAGLQEIDGDNPKRLICEARLAWREQG